MTDTFVPTAEMRAEAQQGLDWRREFGRGGTLVGVARARDLVNGKALPIDTVKRMRSFFARHAVVRDAEGFRPGEDGYPSAGRIAWALWGGDPGRAWSERIVDEKKERSNPMTDPIYCALDHEARRIGGRDVEFRAVTIGTIEVREIDDDDSRVNFVGYAAVFNSPSEPLPFIETIKPGAFRRSLQSGRDLRMFVNHNTDLILGSTYAETLLLSEDQRGLRVEGLLPDTTYGRDLATLMRRGDVHSMSFGFTVPRGGDSWSDDRSSRELREVILHEVSVVTGFPAYPETDAWVRDLDATTDEPIVEPSIPLAVQQRLSRLYARRAPSL